MRQPRGEKAMQDVWLEYDGLLDDKFEKKLKEFFKDLGFVVAGSGYDCRKFKRYLHFMWGGSKTKDV